MWGGVMYRRVDTAPLAVGEKVFSFQFSVFTGAVERRTKNEEPGTELRRAGFPPARE